MSDIVVSEVCNTGEGKQKDIESDEVEIKSGDYWREKETGLIRLLRSLTVIDGILHSVSVLQHPTKQSGFDNNGRPSWTASPDDLTVDEFLDAFAPLFNMSLAMPKGIVQRYNTLIGEGFYRCARSSNQLEASATISQLNAIISQKERGF